jgi:trans-2,3-dihydro-3-hydroxyanthranilate isomerase
MPTYDFVTVDVFTQQRFGGNPLAVVRDGSGLDTAQMQALAAEFNYSETTFVLPPRDPQHTAQVRIFNRKNEMDFAGHPNVGTALVLAAQRAGDRFTFEERAGLVVVDVTRDAAGKPVSACVNAPQPLSILATLPMDGIAACLGLEPADIDATLHPPVVASVGVTFGLVPVRADALERISTRLDAFTQLERSKPELKGRLSLFVYCDATAGNVDARMFAPLDGTYEDPATGSAAAALAAYRLSLTSAPSLDLRIRQGVRMGRPSDIVARAWRENGIRASVSGGCVEVFRGTVTL